MTKKISGNYSDETKYIQKKIRWDPVACCHSVEICRLQITNRGHKSATLLVVLCWCGNRSIAFGRGSVRVNENRVMTVLFVVKREGGGGARRL